MVLSSLSLSFSLLVIIRWPFIPILAHVLDQFHSNRCAIYSLIANPPSLLLLF